MKRLLLFAFPVLIFVFCFQQGSATQTQAHRATTGVSALGIVLNTDSLDRSAYGSPDQAAGIRTAAAKAIKLIQQSQSVWAKKESCASCHHQLLPEIPIRLARERGVAVDEQIARDTSANTFAYLKDLDNMVQGYDYIDVLFDGWALVAAKVAGAKPSLGTAVSAQFIASRQLADGSWPTIDVRPPQSHSPFTTTAVCAQSLRNYLPEQFKNEKESRLKRAREWLLKTRPQTTEDLSFQLLGLLWTGADKSARAKVASELLTQQREDGGWSQLKGMESDAFATGEVLVALHDGASIPVSDPAYQRGVSFLLKNQQADGSWRVGSRLHPPAPVSPPYFETGFPYGHDQFVSAMATSWAAAALLETLPAKAMAAEHSVDITPAEQDEWIRVALNGSAAELKKLLDSGMKPNAKTSQGTTALMIAARDIEKVKLLIERGADVNARAATGINVLMVAARYRGNAETVRLLLRKGASPNPEKGIEVRNSATALFFAVMAGDVQSAGALIEAGATLDRMKILGRFTQSPLLYSVFGDSAMVELLIAKGADPNEVDDDKISPLSWATIGNNRNVVRSLIARGAKVNYADRFGMTPLLYAASIDFGDTSVMEELIAAGADKSATTKEGVSAVDLAKSYHHHSLAAMLAEKTAGRGGVK